LFHRSTNPAEAASLPGGVLFIRRRPLPRHMSGRSWSGTPQDEPAVEGPWALVVVVIFATQPVKDGVARPWGHWARQLWALGHPSLLVGARRSRIR
jgi:hypothetical protein